MIRVEKVDCRNFEAVRDVLADIWGTGGREKGRQIFGYQWQRDESHCGLILLDGNRTVGFLGMIFSRRRIDDRLEKFCNLTSWYVHKNYRSRAISMILALNAMHGYTITDLTPAKNVYAVQHKLGFKDLDPKGRLLMPFGRRLVRPKYAADRMTHDATIIAQHLMGQDLRILKDHQPYPCSHFLLIDDDRYCYIIYTQSKRNRIPYAHLHYISDPGLFERAHCDIRRSILAEARVFFLLIDSRLVRKRKLPVSFCLPYRAPKQFISPTLKPEQIDNLYSELVMLNLRTHPRLKYLFRDIWRKLQSSISRTGNSGPFTQ